MKDQRPLVKNASDKGQVANADQIEKSIKDQEDSDLKFVLSEMRGRRFLKRMLKVCMMEERTIWCPSAEIHKLAGIQSVGIYLKKEMERVDFDSFFKMEREARPEPEPEEKNKPEESNA